MLRSHYITMPLVNPGLAPVRLIVLALLPIAVDPQLLPQPVNISVISCDRGVARDVELARLK